MKRLLAAACAAMLLAGVLTACSSNKNNAAPSTDGGANGTNTSPAGTAYTTPDQTRHSSGTGLDSDTNQNVLTNRKYHGASDGRYTAYSDGTVAGRGTDSARGSTDTGTNSLARGADDLARGVGDAVADAGTGIGNAVHDMTNW